MNCPFCSTAFNKRQNKSRHILYHCKMNPNSKRTYTDLTIYDGNGPKRKPNDEISSSTSALFSVYKSLDDKNVTDDIKGIALQSNITDANRSIIKSDLEMLHDKFQLKIKELQDTKKTILNLIEEKRLSPLTEEEKAKI